MSVNLTLSFRTQNRRITQFVDSIDVNYINDAITTLVNKIKNDKDNNSLQEIYYAYLYGNSFIKFRTQIEPIIMNTLRVNGISGFRLLLSNIGTSSELATYPTLAGIRVDVRTVN